jgi:hypothetical protein
MALPTTLPAWLWVKSFTSLTTTQFALGELELGLDQERECFYV